MSNFYPLAKCLIRNVSDFNSIFENGTSMEQYITFASNNPVLSLAWVAIATMLVVTSIRIKMSKVKQISPQELTFLVNREEGVVVDIRNEKEFRGGHIIDSKHVPSDKIKNNDLASLEKYKDKPIIVVCAAGMTASAAANTLVKQGYSQVNLLKGGLNSWVNASLPLSKK